MKPLSMAIYYHVCQKWDGGELKSRAVRMGSESEAIDEFVRRWPTADDDLAADHCWRVHLYAMIDEARDHLDRYGGEILAIDGDWVTVEMDGKEFPHPMAWSVPAHAIAKV